MFFTIYRREAWNRPDPLILVLTSPQARQSSRDGHRVCEGLFSHYCVHTCWIPFGLPGRRFQAVHPTPDGKQPIDTSASVYGKLYLCTLPFLALLCCSSVFHNILPVSGLSRHRPLSTPWWNLLRLFFLSSHESLHKWMIGSSSRETGEQCDCTQGSICCSPPPHN